MAGSPSTIKESLILYRRLRELLSARKKVIISGYALSNEAGAPHFYDMQKGVWSRNESALRPFDSEMGRVQVLNWFQWRARLITRCKGSPSYRALKGCQASLKAPHVSQCVDGLAKEAGICELHEIYGNVFALRCFQCHELIPAEKPMREALGYSQCCPACRYPLLPNVDMFGCKGNAEVLASARQLIKEADVVIKVGTDDDLEPFSDAARQSRQARVTVQAGGVLLTLGETSELLESNAIREIQKHAAGSDCAAVDSMLPYERMLSLLGGVLEFSS